MNKEAGDKQLYNEKKEEVGVLHRKPQSRHWLSYPVTHHEISAWKRINARLPNSLRFKAVRDKDGKLRGRIFHVPCKPPSQFRPSIQTIERVWRQVHAHLDGELEREGLR